jgi:hypothetical protein
MTTTFESAKVGDKVYSHTFGWGEIDRVEADKTYAIYVRFINLVDQTIFFTVEGYCMHTIQTQSLFWDECQINAPVKPAGVKVINGIEIPDISFKPDIDDHCYIPFPTVSSLYTHHIVNFSNVANEHLSVNGLCYPYTEEGRDAAILHAKAMLGVHL